MHRLKNIVFLVTALFLPLNTLTSQSQEIIITVAVADHWINDQLITSFEQQYPNVKVIPVPIPAFDGYSEFATYATSADVLYINDYFLNPAVTRAGYLLDLNPLVLADNAQIRDDFLPSVWRAYEWDGGLWGLPSSVQFSLVRYDKSIFGQVGLAYPSADWTLNDFASATQQLTANGENVAFWGSSALLLRSVYGENFYDVNTIPHMPRFDVEELAGLLEEWGQLLPVSDISIHTGLQFALTIETLPTLNPSASDSYVLLPNGHAGMSAQGLAISSGTIYPEIAYELIKYLTASPDFLLNQVGNVPAHNRLYQLSLFDRDLSDETLALHDLALNNALSATDMIYGDYLANVLVSLPTYDTRQDLMNSLQRVETLARENMQQVFEISQNLSLSVVIPDHLMVSNDRDGLILRFGISPQPHIMEDEWRNLIDEFILLDGQVDDIVTKVNHHTHDIMDLDCFYLNFNPVQNMDLSLLLSLDPLMNSDPNFNPSDFVSGALGQVQRNDQTWAFPIALSPLVFWYNQSKFDQLGIPTPSHAGWLINDFDAVVETLSVDPSSPYTAVVGSFRGSYYLYLLMGAWGNPPLDYRQNPPTIHLTDPNTIASIRHVLDLGRDDLIRYQIFHIPPQGVNAGTGGQTNFSIYASVLSVKPQADGAIWRVTMLPRGETMIPVFYLLQTAMINVTTPYPEACYRWISFLSQQVDFYQAMPAQRSLSYSEQAETVFDRDMLDFLQSYEQTLQSPDVVVYPSIEDNALLIELEWLYRAFDRYVFDEADLEVELASAEQFIYEYRACADALNPTIDYYRDYLLQLMDCRAMVDPTIAN